MKETCFFPTRVSIATGSAFIFLSLALSLLSTVYCTHCVQRKGNSHIIFILTVKILLCFKVFSNCVCADVHKTAELYTLILKRILQILDDKFPGEQ